jgi:hypothetical protein
MTFNENIGLLVITAALTGVLVPFIKTTVDYIKLKQQKIFEADQLRQSQRIQAQIDTLGNLSELLWSLQYLMLEASYYQSYRNAGDDTHERQLAAMKKYDLTSWESFAKIGIAIGKAQPLVNDATYQRLKDFFRNWLVKMDNRYSALATDKSATTAQWLQHHEDLFIKGALKIDDVLGSLAQELQLAGPRRDAPRAVPKELSDRKVMALDGEMIARESERD